QMGEDLLFNLTYLDVCRQINFIQKPLYNYNLHHNASSLTRNYRKNLWDDQQKMLDQIKAFLMENGCYSRANETFIREMYTANMIKGIGNMFHKNAALTLR